MRQIVERIDLPTRTAGRLEREIQAVVGSADNKAEASIRYVAARRAAWFRPIHQTLSIMSGAGQRCMYCSGSESAQVEHYRPNATYPRLALDWANYLWVCGICNQYKGATFDETVCPINPIDDFVWEHFFIDEFGNLCPRWKVDLDDVDPRARVTIDMLGLDRQPLQETRLHRLIELKSKIADSLALFNRGDLNQEDLQLRALEWFEQPFQLDVVDFFFDGPGRQEEPFREFFTIAGL